MTFDTMRMDKKLTKAGFDEQQTEIITECFQESQAEMKTGFSELRTEFAELKAELEELKIKFSELKVEFAELKAEFAALKTEFAELKTEFVNQKYQTLLGMAIIVSLAVAVLKWT